MASVDVARFWVDWTDIQVTRAFGGVSGGANGGKATSKGIEGSLALRPAPGLTISATGSYTDATLSEDVADISGLKGDRLPAVPKFSGALRRSEEHTSELQPLMRISYAVFCLNKKNIQHNKYWTNAST